MSELERRGAISLLMQKIKSLLAESKKSESNKSPSLYENIFK